MTGLYEGLGVPVALNGVGPATRLGGLPLHPDVWAAMQESLASPVRMDVFEEAAGRRIAELLGAPAAYVTSGASAAMLLGTAAAMTGGRADLVDRLPDTTGMRRRVLIQAAHRDPYDRAVAPTGAVLETIGYPDSTHPDELDRALGDDVAAVLYRPGKPGNLLSLAATAEIAHAHDVPVIVDGAVHAPGLERLRALFTDGADLVALSGGKGFRGPQASGLLLGRADLVAAVGAQHQDMDERLTTWPPGLAAGRRTPPRHGPGRPMKVGREQIAGLLAALERYVRDPGGDEAPGIAELDETERVLREGGAEVTRHHDAALDVPSLHVRAGDGAAAVDALVLALAARPVPAYVGEAEAWRGIVTINPMALRPGDGVALGIAIVESLEHR